MTLTTCRRYWSCVSRYSMAANRLWYPYTMMEPRPSRSSAPSVPRIPGAVESCLHWPENERMSKRVCVRLPTSADNVTLPAFAADCRARSRCCRAAHGGQTISTGRRAHGSKPAAAACGGQMMGQTDGRTLYRYIDPAAYYASSVMCNIYRKFF